MDFFFGSPAPALAVAPAPTTPITTSTTRSPFQDRTNLLISPFGMSPKAIIASKASPAKTFTLHGVEEDDGYASAKSDDDVDRLLNGDWKPNYDIAIDDDMDTPIVAAEQNLLLPTVLEPSVMSAVPVATPYKYTEEDIATMKAEWQKAAEKEREESAQKVDAVSKKVSELQHKEGEYLALIAEFETTITALEAEKSARDQTSMEAFARQLSDLEVENTRLRTDKAEMEGAFQQLHKRYEQLKTLQANAVKNEGILKQTLAKSQSDLMAAEARFLRLKTHAQTQLDAANAEINRIRDESVKKSLLLAAKLSLSQTQLESLNIEHSLAQTENETLRSVISDLCSQLGHSIPSISTTICSN